MSRDNCKSGSTRRPPSPPYLTARETSDALRQNGYITPPAASAIASLHNLSSGGNLAALAAAVHQHHRVTSRGFGRAQRLWAALKAVLSSKSTSVCCADVGRESTHDTTTYELRRGIKTHHNTTRHDTSTKN